MGQNDQNEISELFSTSFFNILESYFQFKIYGIQWRKPSRFKKVKKIPQNLKIIFCWKIYQNLCH